MVYDWDTHQKACYQLYINEGRSLEDIMDHMRTVYKFTPSKRAFQTQFRRWNFPAKQQPAHRNERLVNRVRELWEKNLPQREILRILNQEDGFNIRSRELMRLRTRNRWLLRVPNGSQPADVTTAQLEPSEDIPSPATDGDSTLSLPNDQDASLIVAASTPDVGGGSVLHVLPDNQVSTDAGDNTVAKKRKRNRQSVDAAGTQSRFPSETTIDEARVILSLEAGAYRDIRACFQRICVEEDVSKKTLAGVSRWEGVKDRLIQESPALQAALWATKDDEETKKLALDIICTDVTKRMRTLETRVTLAEAKNMLGINPEESREIRAAFHQVLVDAQFTCKSDATAREWDELKQKWMETSPLIRRLVPVVSGPASKHKARALEIIARDVMKRLRDDRTRKDPKQKQKQADQHKQQEKQRQQQQQQQQPQQQRQQVQHLEQEQRRQQQEEQTYSTPPQQPPQPQPQMQPQQQRHQGQADQNTASFGMQGAQALGLGQVGGQGLAGDMGFGDGMNDGGFGQVSSAQHAVSQMSFDPSGTQMVAHLPLGLPTAQPSNMADATNSLPQPHRVLGSSMGPLSFEPHLRSAFFAASAAQNAFMDQSYVQPAFAPAPAPEPRALFTPMQQPVATWLPVYIRRRPDSTYQPNLPLWIDTITSEASLEELRQVVVKECPGAECGLIEGVFKDGKGPERQVDIGDDDELKAYLAFLRGRTPVFAVQLMPAMSEEDATV